MINNKLDKYLSEIAKDRINESDVEDKKKIHKTIKELEKIVNKMEKIKFEDAYFKSQNRIAVNYVWTAIKNLKDAL
jgi:Na+/phosphate symporter